MSTRIDGCFWTRRWFHESALHCTKTIKNELERMINVNNAQMHVVNERIQKNGDVYVTQVPHLCVCPRGSPRVDNDTLGWFDDE